MKLKAIATGHNNPDFFDSLKGDNILNDTISELRSHIKKDSQALNNDMKSEGTEQKTNNRGMKM